MPDVAGRLAASVDEGVAGDGPVQDQQGQDVDELHLLRLDDQLVLSQLGTTSSC